MRVKLLVLGLFLSTSTQIIAQHKNEQLQAPAKIIESFEEEIPEGLRSTGKALSIDSKRIKQGNQSLKWQWKGNDQILFDTPIGYCKQRMM